MPKIQDVIRIESQYYGVQFFVVLDTMPEFVYERKGNNLVASDDGFYDCLFYERPTKYSKAFGGREFELPMKDGSVIKASGQWWDGGYSDNAPEEIIPVGINTIAGLHHCYVFSSGHISKEKLARWLDENEPSGDYHKYDEKYIRHSPTTHGDGCGERGKGEYRNGN